MVYIPKKFNYLGIDETTLNIGKKSSLVVVAQTYDKLLTHESPYELKKSKDFLKHADYNNQSPKFPSLEELILGGLSKYHWMRCNSGNRFSKQEFQHAIIAHMIQVNGYKPHNTLVQIDAFYGANIEKSKYLISEYLKRRSFNISPKNIDIVGQGDKKIPIINFADILAFQIGVSLGNKHESQIKYDIEVENRGIEEKFDEKRIIEPISQDNRDEFERIIRER